MYIADKTFSEKRLRAIRKREGKSYSDMAHALSVPEYIYKYWERGTFVPSKHSINKLCVILRCDEADLCE